MATDKQPMKRAVALRYDQGADEAPTVIASGKGLVAEKIVELARDAGIPVEADPGLAEALGQVEIGTAIPEDLYPVVAELLVFISRMNKKRGSQFAASPGSAKRPAGQGGNRP